jgi:phage terminase small subunit
MNLSNLPPPVLKYLNAKSDADLLPLLCVDYQEYYQAAEHLRNCPFNQLPLYINNPSIMLSNIIKDRLREGV